MGADEPNDQEPSIPEAGPDGPPVYDEPERPAPQVVNAPERNTEF